MKRTAGLFWEILSRPHEALTSLAAANMSLKAPAAIFITYHTLNSFVLAKLPPAFVTYAPLNAFSNAWYFYLTAAPLNLLMAALLAAVLPSAAVFFSRGRASSRVVAGAAVLIAGLGGLAVAQRSGAAAWCLVGAFILWALVAMRNRHGAVRAMLAVILASSAISLALLPAQALSIILHSKPLFETLVAAEAIWTLWLFTKALGVIGNISAPRAAATVFFTAAIFGVLAFALAALLPAGVAAFLLIC